MSGYVMAAAGYWASIAVLEGPRLLSGVDCVVFPSPFLMRTHQELFSTLDAAR